MIPKQARTLLAEALGAFMLIFGGTLTIAGTGVIDSGPIAHLVIALAFGLSLLAGLLVFAEISGGHFNPAVSLAMWLSKRLSTKDLIGYWVAQFVGGIGAGVFLYWITSRAVVKSTVSQPGPGTSVGTALLVEALLTALFILVILKASEMGHVGLVGIALTLAVVHLAGIPFTGASVNPARTLGPALIGGQWHALWIYFAGPAIGAVIAWVVHTVVVKGEMPKAPKLA